MTSHHPSPAEARGSRPGSSETLRRDNFPYFAAAPFGRSDSRPSFHEWRRDRHENLMGYAFHSGDDDRSGAGFPQVINSRPGSGHPEFQD